MSAALNRAVAYFLPPVVTDLVRRMKRQPAPSRTAEPPEWEAVENTDRAWMASAGWAHASVVAEQRRKWSAVIAAIGAPRAFGKSHEADLDLPVGVSEHNLIMTFGYVLGRVAGVRPSLRILDWGGGIGHYYALARALRPDLRLEYTIKDLPDICAAGRELNPECRYIDDESAALSQRYDFVFASSSILYSRDVHGLMRRLCAAADTWLMITRQPIVENHDDFVVIQRPYAYGYHTEYAGWFLNRERLMATVRSQGFGLEREFLLDNRPFVHNAPEQCRFSGFLFKHASATE